MDCPNCSKTLQICDHSPFEHSYTLYCSDCPKRVDVGVYEPVFEEIKDYSSMPYEAVMQAIEKRLAPCDCGGKFLVSAKRRCLHCHYPLALREEQNVWLKEYWSDFDDEEEEEKVEQLMQSYIVEPQWKKMDS